MNAGGALPDSLSESDCHLLHVEKRMITLGKHRSEYFMKEKTGKFIRILSVEMRDMEEGIEMLIASTRERHQKKQITEYVKTENVSLLQHELNNLKLIHLEIDKLSEDQFESLDDVKARIREILKDRGELPRAVQLFLEKRMDKVIQYMKQE